jgi:flagellar biosynthesis/type III secretory pathway M-ring protein FliF/YscJ
MGRRRRKNADATHNAQDAEIDQFLSGFGEGEGSKDVLHEPAMRHTAPAVHTESADVIAQRQVVSEMAAQQPDDVARALRNWLNTKGS